MTTALHAECRSGKAIFESFFRQQAKCPHHIAEIETAGFNGDFHILAFKRLALNGVPGELVQGTLAQDIQPHGRFRAFRQRNA